MAAGTRKDDIVHNAYGYGLFTGGLGVHYGAEKLGASVIPISGGNTKRQIMIMKDFGPTVLTCTPSYALHLAEVAEEMGVSFRDLKFKAGIFGAEPWSESMRREIERKLNLKAIDIYGLSEVMGPGVSIECVEAQNGLHVFEDHFIPEIINPDTGEVLPPRAPGRARVHHPHQGSLPGDPLPHPGHLGAAPRALPLRPDASCAWAASRAAATTCSSSAASTSSRRRSRASSWRPARVEPHYQLVVDRIGTLDQLTVLVEVNESMFSDDIKNLQTVERELEKNIRETLGVTTVVKLVEPKSIQRSEGKAVRVIDKRKL